MSKPTLGSRFYKKQENKKKQVGFVTSQIDEKD